MGRSLSIYYKSLLQLPPHETFHYFLYQIQLQSGYTRLVTPKKSRNKNLDKNILSPQWFNFFSEKRVSATTHIDKKQIIKDADKLLSGKFTAFGELEMKLNFEPFTPPKHWSHCQSINARTNQQDIKYIWEPARFSWSIRLGQAFFLTHDEKYSQFFWSQYSNFKKNNPLNIGPNWSSAQEVSLRLIAWIITLDLLKTSTYSTESKLFEISKDLADHADRIMGTLSYAKAQNNNHIISEAVGLYSAGTFLSKHPRSSKWKTVGKKLFERAIRLQIDQNGEYIQHSTNYHRMMLTLSLWMAKLYRINNEEINSKTISKLDKSISWLLNLLDLQSGKVPNIGHNDGSLIFPFSNAEYADYRPIIQAASNLFSGISLLQPGNHNDLCEWLDIETKPNNHIDSRSAFTSPRIGDEESWGILRAARYKSRPAHADQLHVDLWFKGINVLMDAGTYQYNARKPWDNGLAATNTHNTITLQKKDQMTRGGRFLWLDWAQAHISEYTNQKIIAAHDGYLKLGAVHERALIQKTHTHWQVIDHLYKMKAAKNPLNIDLHWLLPDWDYEIIENSIILNAPFGTIHFQVQFNENIESTPLIIYKSGKSMNSTDIEKPILGWVSPTYGIKKPALSILCSFNQKLPCTITTNIKFS